MNECIKKSQRREGLVSLFEGHGKVTVKSSQSSHMQECSRPEKEGGVQAGGTAWEKQDLGMSVHEQVEGCGLRFVEGKVDWFDRGSYE